MASVTAAVVSVPGRLLRPAAARDASRSSPGRFVGAASARDARVAVRLRPGSFPGGEIRTAASALPPVTYVAQGAAGRTRVRGVWIRTSADVRSRRRRGVATVPAVRSSGDDARDDAAEEMDVDEALESVRAKSRSMLAEATSLEKAVNRMEMESAAGDVGDATVSETTVIVRSKSKKNGDAVSASLPAVGLPTSAAGVNGSIASPTAAPSKEDTVDAPPPAKDAKKEAPPASAGAKAGEEAEAEAPELLKRAEESRREREKTQGAASPKPDTVLAVALAGATLVAAGGNAALGGVVASEPLFALLGSTAAFATLKAIEIIAPKLEAYQLEQARKTASSADAPKKAKATPVMPKAVNKPISAAGAAAAVAVAKKAAADAEVDKLLAEEARAAAMLAEKKKQLEEAAAAVAKAESLEKTIRAGEMAAAAQNAASAVGAVKTDSAETIPVSPPTAGTVETEEEEEVAMKARAKSLLSMGETADAEAPNETPRAKISKVNPAMTPEEIAAFWREDTPEAGEGETDEDIQMTPPNLDDIPEQAFPDPVRRTNWVIVLANILLWPLTVPFRIVRMIVRFIVKLFGGGDAVGEK